jgi:GNAT superfamily N-acetyltransferase
VPDVVVRPPARGERGRAAGVLVDALAGDPSWSHVLPDPEDRRAALRILVAVALADAGRHARVAVSGARILGAAVWQPPGRYPMSPWRQVRAVPRMLPLLAARPGPARDIKRLGDALDAVFPTGPVRYLQILGVAPSAQGQGVGSRLLREGLRGADAARHDVYLETGKEANVAFYTRSGFALVAPGGPLYAGGPAMWRMRRPPARGSGAGAARDSGRG